MSRNLALYKIYQLTISPSFAWAVEFLLSLALFPRPLLGGLVLPIVGQQHRATLLSLVNFGSHICVAAVVFLLAFASDPGSSLYSQISEQLLLGGSGCLFVWVALVLARPKLD